MSVLTGVTEGTVGCDQAVELALLVDLEARWENLRTNSPQSMDVQPSLKDLHSKQKAYDAFRVKLVAYNKEHAPAHIPELLLNTPARLSKWCRAMRDLYLQVEHNPQGHCPVHLMEKAYRWADRLAIKVGKEPVSRSPAPATIRAAVQDLEALSQWCDDVTSVARVA